MIIPDQWCIFLLSTKNTSGLTSCFLGCRLKIRQFASGFMVEKDPQVNLWQSWELEQPRHVPLTETKSLLHKKKSFNDTRKDVEMIYTWRCMCIYVYIYRYRYWIHNLISNLVPRSLDHLSKEFLVTPSESRCPPSPIPHKKNHAFWREF